jgi:acyl-coenzyme A thioesterase PaaI-like protein
MQVKADRYCFACGADNPQGLHLQFRTEGEEYVCDYTPAPEHQGWQDVVHGGIAATVLDEVMTRLLWEQGLEAVTARLSVRYRQPVPVGRPANARARLVRRRGRLVEVASELRLEDGSVATEAEGTFLILPQASE